MGIRVYGPFVRYKNSIHFKLTSLHEQYIWLPKTFVHELYIWTQRNSVYKQLVWLQRTSVHEQHVWFVQYFLKASVSRTGVGSFYLHVHFMVVFVSRKAEPLLDCKTPHKATSLTMSKPIFTMSITSDQNR